MVFDLRGTSEEIAENNAAADRFAQSDVWFVLIEAFWNAAVSSFFPSPAAPKSLTFIVADAPPEGAAACA